MPPIRDATEAARALEATLLRQLITSSGAFKGGEAAGGKLQAEMFVEALADAVAKGGGIGLAGMIQRSLGEAPEEAPKPLAPTSMGMSLMQTGKGTSGEAPRVTSNFGARIDPLDGSKKFHTGVDLAGSEGTPIHAAAGGIVKNAGPRGGYGNAVEIDHGNGISTLYGHASSVDVKPGQRVAPGQEVARVGETGRATGPHLHFEVRVEGRPIDPATALKAYGIRAEKTMGAKPEKL
jgi:murein DD-endopeptidase MepM/ murein hydrolase activator NlpD